MKLLDTVALLDDIPEKGLRRGQVGTLVEELDPDVFEVESADLKGRAYALAAVEASRLMPLHHVASRAA